jgi:putative flippase GtrA
MRILRDGLHFLLIGAIQLAVDSAIYIALTKAGAAPLPANLCGRIAGAALGFWLNGRITFLHHVQPVLHVRMARYVVLWVTLTIISTVALTSVVHYGGLARSWWAKPLIEAALGLTSFLISRHWVYRH